VQKINRAARAREREAARIEILKIRRTIIEAWKCGTIRELCQLCAEKGICCEMAAQAFLYGKGKRLPSLETVRRIAEIAGDGK
jgi:hypothetical protein